MISTEKFFNPFNKILTFTKQHERPPLKVITFDLEIPALLFSAFSIIFFNNILYLLPYKNQPQTCNNLIITLGGFMTAGDDAEKEAQRDRAAAEQAKKHAQQDLKYAKMMEDASRKAHELAEAEKAAERAREND
jgi:hypothetical protein